MGDQGILKFDLDEGERLRDEGIEQAEDVFWRRNLMASARKIAYELAMEWGEVTADDVFLIMSKRGLRPELMGNAWGGLFRGETFEFTGKWRKSERVSNHARMNRVWSLREE